MVIYVWWWWIMDYVHYSLQLFIDRTEWSSSYIDDYYFNDDLSIQLFYMMMHILFIWNAMFIVILGGIMLYPHWLHWWGNEWYALNIQSMNEFYIIWYLLLTIMIQTMNTYTYICIYSYICLYKCLELITESKYHWSWSWLYLISSWYDVIW